MGVIYKFYNYTLHKLFWSNFMSSIRESHKEMCYNEGYDDCIEITNKYVGGKNK